jgi:hypothetical protein
MRRKTGSHWDRDRIFDRDRGIQTDKEEQRQTETDRSAFKTGR